MPKVLSLSLLFILGFICFTNAAFNPPSYSQHDSKWGDEILGEGPETISGKGCLLTAMASMIASQGIKVHGSTPNPDNMNSYFKSQGEFEGNILYYKAPESLGFTYEGSVTNTDDIIGAMREGKFAILNVLNGRHWVLATGSSNGEYSVMDPADVTNSYDYDAVVKCALYSLNH